jgi:outer membrane protein OmpA-like peptidoglycan-associated protein
MSFSLIDQLKGVFNNDLISKAAASFGENEGAVSKAVSAGIPSLLSGIIGNAATDGGSNVLNLAKQAGSSGIMDNIGSMFSSSGNNSLLSSGSGLLSGLMGSKSSALTNLLSNFAGVKSSTSNSILSAIAPLALGFIGKHAMSNNLGAGGVLNWLMGQKDEVQRALPAGLNLSGIMGEPSVARPATTVHTTNVETPARKSILPYLLLGLLALALLWYLMRSCNKDATVTPVETKDSVTTQQPVVVDTVKTITSSTTREVYKVTLPNGVVLDAWKGGIEDKLVTFLNDSTTKAGKDVWFDFDDLNFETGSAKLTAESNKQVGNIAAVLKAYPKVKIKIGGYTDKTGDAAKNKKLSMERASAVAAALKAAGAIAAQVTGAEGYGSEFAKVDAAASDEERRKDRRIAVSVRAK